MRAKNRYQTVIALVLCAALLSFGSPRPATAYAAIGDDVDEGYDDVYDDDYDNEEEDPEPAASDDSDDEEPVTSSAVSSQLDTLYSQRDQLETNISSLKDQEKQLQNRINSAQSEKEKAILARNSLAYEITLRSDLISALEQKVTNLELGIALRQKFIEAKQAEIDYNFALLGRRLKAMYMQDDGTMLGLLLGSDSFSDFLSRSEYMVRIAEHDHQLMQDLMNQRAELELEMESLETDKLEVEADKSEVEAEKQTLGSKHQEAAKQVQDIGSMEQEYLADLERNRAKQDAAKAELNKVFQQIEWSKNAYVGGAMAWPLPGHATLTSHFGSRFNGADFHTGLDISSNGSGCYGATIVAANDGIVKMVNTAYQDGVGYGIYVIIDHGVDENGNQIATLYAHCSAILVSLNQQVKRGDPIAQVGSTGWSTGPHLHFEVRINGSYVNPASYIGL